MDISITRTDKEFRCALSRYVAQEEVSYDSVARALMLNKWHINQFLNNPAYQPSRRVKRLCNIRSRKPDNRVCVHAGSDMKKKDEQIRKLTNNRYALVELPQEEWSENE